MELYKKRISRLEREVRKLHTIAVTIMVEIELVKNLIETSNSDELSKKIEQIRDIALMEMRSKP
jgi:hypothetical protein